MEFQGKRYILDLSNDSPDQPQSLGYSKKVTEVVYPEDTIGVDAELMASMNEEAQKDALFNRDEAMYRLGQKLCDEFIEPLLKDFEIVNNELGAEKRFERADYEFLEHLRILLDAHCFNDLFKEFQKISGFDGDTEDLYQQKVCECFEEAVYRIEKRIEKGKFVVHQIIEPLDMPKDYDETDEEAIEYEFCLRRVDLVTEEMEGILSEQIEKEEVDNKIRQNVLKDEADQFGNPLVVSKQNYANYILDVKEFGEETARAILLSDALATAADNKAEAENYNVGR